MDDRLRFFIPLTCVLVFSLWCTSQTSEAAVDRQVVKWLNSSPMIDSIFITGNTALSRNRLLEQLYSKENSFFRALRNERRRKVQRESLNRDTLELKYVYLIQGFLGVRVAQSFEVLEPDSTALIRISISEGRQFRYGTFTLSGDIDTIERLRYSRFARSLHYGRPINPFELQNLGFRIKEDLSNHGYPYSIVSVLPDTNSPDALSPIAITIARDSLVSFGSIEIEGPNRFPKKVVERELRFKPGQTYRRESILSSQRYLYATGNYTSVQIEPLPLSPRQSPTLRVRVRERKPYFLTLKAGAGQSEFRAIQLDGEGQVGQRNFFGYRRYDFTSRYSLGFGAGEKPRLLTHEYILRYTEPRPLNLRFPVSASVTWQPPLNDEVFDINLESWRLTLETRRRNLGRWSWGIGAEYIWTTLTQLDSVSPAGEAIREQQQRRKGFVEIRYDGRDNLFVPSRGLLATTSFQQFGGPLGGDGNFIKAELSLATYLELRTGLISASRVSYGIAREADNNTLSFADEALFTGGANSVRGFRDNRLGPLDENGDPTGARYVIVANQEFRWQTVQILKYVPLLGSLLRPFPLWQSAFVDVGNGFSEAREIRLDNFALSVGTGVQLVTPAGPLRLDYARVIPSQRFSSQERFHFTILYAF